DSSALRREPPQPLATPIYGRSGLPCSGLLCSGLLLECAFSCGALECCAGARSACELPCDSFVAWLLPREESGAGRGSRPLCDRTSFGRDPALSRLPALRLPVFGGRSLWLTFRLEGDAL